MRVVLDTNVFISSFFGGKPRAVIDLWKRGRITFCLSREIVAEYIEVLQRLEIDENETARVLSLFAGGFNTLFTAKTPNLTVVENDPDDDKFIECAVALSARCIVSGDSHLLDVEDYMGIQIVTPARFLQQHTA